MLCACIDVDSSSDVAQIASVFPGNTNKAIKQLKTGIKESAEPVRYQLACCLVILPLSACAHKICTHNACHLARLITLPTLFAALTLGIRKHRLGCYDRWTKLLRMLHGSSLLGHFVTCLLNQAIGGHAH